MTRQATALKLMPRDVIHRQSASRLAGDTAADTGCPAAGRITGSLASGQTWHGVCIAA
jgi:hypothetical protein